jgi:hypothetical protein
MNCRVSLFVDDQGRACSVYRANTTTILIRPVVGVMDSLPKDLHFSKYEGPEFILGCAHCIFLAWAAAWAELHSV